MNETPDTYVHGHHESVLRSHTWRTAENSAQYLLAHLRPGQTLLDVGCGPGTITIDLAKRVAPGAVVGMDAVADVIAKAVDNLDATDTPNCSFTTGDVYSIDHPDDSFDVVHAHQVLQHLRDPVAALREMRRVARAGGMVAARDADYTGMHWAPRSAGLDRWLELYHQICSHNDVEPDAGRCLLGWAQQAGFESIDVSSATWTFATDETRRWWSGLWADRIRESNYADQALAQGLADRDELEQLAAAWLAWADQPHAVFVVPHGQILALA